MRTNLEDIAKSRSFKFEEETEYFVEIKDVIALLQFVREKTLEECSKEFLLDEDRESILQLDKDSIEI